MQMKKRINMRAMLGVGGVPESENARARRFGQLMETAVLMALALVFLQVFLVVFGQTATVYWIDLLIWAIFAAEFMGSLLLVDQRWRYVRYNWMNALIVFLAFPWLPWGEQYALVFQSLRLMLILRFSVHFFDTALEILRRNRFGQVIGLAALLVVFAGAVFAYLEERSFGDGVWWALVTITTVGYGDVVPVSESGRIFGAFMIIFGVVLFSLVTANISAFLVEEEQTRVEQEILQKVKDNNERLIRQEQLAITHVEQLLQQLSEMERRHDRHIEAMMRLLTSRVAQVELELKSMKSLLEQSSLSDEEKKTMRAHMQQMHDALSALSQDMLDRQHT